MAQLVQIAGTTHWTSVGILVTRSVAGKQGGDQLVKMVDAASHLSMNLSQDLLTCCHAGESGVDQLVEIIKVLGTPSREEIHAMNPNYTEFKFPQIKAHPWAKVFSKRMPPDAVDLVSQATNTS